MNLTALVETSPSYEREIGGILYRAVEPGDWQRIMELREIEFNKRNLAGGNIRYDKYDPEAAVFVAEDQGRLVGTVRVVEDSSQGLPLDGLYDISYFRRTLGKIGETGRLAVDSDYQIRTDVSIRLVETVYMWGIENMFSDYFAMTVPKHGARYQRLGMTVISTGTDYFEQVQSPAILLRWPLSNTKKEFFEGRKRK